MAENKYLTLGKDAMVAEIKRRRAAGSPISIDLRSSEDELAKALLMDDAESPAGAPAPVPPAPVSAPPVDGTLGNQLAKQPEVPSLATQPTEEDWKKAFLAKNVKDDGFTYQVIKTSDETKPVKARIPAQASGHPGKFWEGTQEEYASTFEKL